MIHIDLLRLQLPAGFEDRAQAISNLVGEGLSAIQISGEKRYIDRIDIGKLQIHNAMNDSQVAGRIVQAIGAHIQSR